MDLRDPEQKTKKQIVNNEHEGDDIEPDQTNFLGEKNQKYKHETIPKKVAPFSSTQKTIAKIVKKRKLIKMKDLAPDKFAYRESIKNDGEFPRGTLYNSNSGYSSNNDFIENVKIGDETHLNTKKYKYWGYYHRIRTRLEPLWENILFKKVRDLRIYHKKKFSSEGFYTMLRIYLDQDGNLVKVKTLISSGESELDNLAIKAIEEASPYRGVPKGLLNNGMAVIEWGFVVTL